MIPGSLKKYVKSGVEKSFLKNNSFHCFLNFDPTTPRIILSTSTLLPLSYPKGVTAGITSLAAAFIFLENPALLKVPPSQHVPKPTSVKYRIIFSSANP
ncbi:MAG: hypothetical protein NTZ89_06135 [Actinobacteria bacterium]|nr:hypothetical protein [Actinomycetota bacterium]